MGRVLKSRIHLSAIEWITLFLLVMFCTFALVPEVREWVLDYVHQIARAVVDGDLSRIARL